MRYSPSHLRPLWVALGVMIVVLALTIGLISPVSAQSPLIWANPVPISDPDTSNWYADIAVDIYGTPHVVWDGGLTLSDRFAPQKKLHTMLMYSHLAADETWTRPLDVVALVQESFTLENMPQVTLASDDEANLWLWYAGGLIEAPVEGAADTAANWTKPLEVSRSIVYSGQAFADKNGFLHAIYDEPTLLQNPYGRGINKITQLGDIYYRRSIDGGRTWTAPFNLSRTEVGETNARLTADSQGILYATWDEGWDRQMDQGRPRRSVLTVSYDGGHTWSPNNTFSYPGFNNVQFTATGNGQDGVLAVWRTTADKEIYFSWSSNRGVSWHEPQILPGLYARVWEDTQFDSYDLVADSAGTIHLVAVGRLRPNAEESQLYHLSWDGRRWSDPNIIYPSIGWPESPRLAISQGNQLHAVWFVRDRLDLAYHSRYQVWYSHVIVDAPSEALPPPPTATPLPSPTPLNIANLTVPLPKSAISGDELAALEGIRADAFFSDDDLPMLIAKSVAPLAAVVAGLFVSRQLKQRR